MSQGYTKNFTELNPEIPDDVLPFRRARILTEIVRRIVKEQGLLESEIDGAISTLTAHIKNYDNPHQLGKDMAPTLYAGALYWMYLECLSTSGTAVTQDVFNQYMAIRPSLQFEVIRLWQLNQGSGIDYTNLYSDTLFQVDSTDARPIIPLYTYTVSLPRLYFPFLQDMIAVQDASYNYTLRFPDDYLTKAQALTAEAGVENIGYGIWPDPSRKVVSVYCDLTSSGAVQSPWIVLMCLNGYSVAIGGMSTGQETFSIADMTTMPYPLTLSAVGMTTINRPRFCMTLDGDQLTVWWYTEQASVESRDTTKNYGLWQKTVSTIPAYKGTAPGNVVLTNVPLGSDLLCINQMDPTTAGVPTVDVGEIYALKDSLLMNEMIVFEGYPTDTFLSEHTTPAINAAY